jgi:hypothetical protein
LQCRSELPFSPSMLSWAVSSSFSAIPGTSTVAPLMHTTAGPPFPSINAELGSFPLSRPDWRQEGPGYLLLGCNGQAHLSLY